MNTTCLDNICDANFICQQCNIYFVGNIKSCPNCRTKIQKDGECDHITCIICEHEWCWECKQEWENNHMCRFLQNI